jgi:hypothetical protein
LSPEELTNDGLTQKYSELLPNLKKYCKPVIGEVKVENGNITTAEDHVDEAVNSTINEIRSVRKYLEIDEETHGESTGIKLTDSNEEPPNDLLEPVLAPASLRPVSVTQLRLAIPLSPSIEVADNPNYNKAALVELEAPCSPVLWNPSVLDSDIDGIETIDNRISNRLGGSHRSLPTSTSPAESRPLNWNVSHQ